MPSIVTKLYDELDTLRNSICNKCKKKISHASGPAGNLNTLSTLAPAPLWRRVFGGRPAQLPSGILQTEAIPDVRNVEPSGPSSSIRQVVPPLAMQPQTSTAVDNIA